jgi:hypothetical protein
MIPAAPMIDNEVAARPVVNNNAIPIIDHKTISVAHYDAIPIIDNYLVWSADNEPIPIIYDRGAIRDNNCAIRIPHNVVRSGRRVSHDWRGSRRAEKRLAMADSVEVQAGKSGPVAFKDHQRAAVVPAPQIADFVATLVDDAELVFLLCVGRHIELNFDVQILLRVGLVGSRDPRPRAIEFCHLGDVPGRRIGRQSAGLIGPRHRGGQ